MMELLVGLVIVGIILYIVLFSNPYTSTYTYVARCRKCGAIVKESQHLRFLNAFFLPDFCPECGSRDGFKIEFGKWEKGKWITKEIIQEKTWERKQ